MIGTKIKILVCENLREEIETAAHLAGWHDVAITTYPASCMSPTVPPNLSDDSKKLVSDDSGGFRVVFNLQCTSNHPRTTQRLKPHRVDVEFKSCFELFLPTPLVENYLKSGAYLVTPGWLARWRKYIDIWGFDQTTAIEYFQESTAKIVLLDTTLTNQNIANLNAFCEFINRPSEIVPVGLDYLRLFMSKMMLEYQFGQMQESQAESTETNHRVSNYAMVFDMITDLTGIRDEKVVVEKIILVFDMLFAPGEIIYVPYKDHQPGDPFSNPKMVTHFDTTELQNYRFKDTYILTESGDGFVMKIKYQNESLGLIIIRRLALPQYLEQYLNMALMLVNVCGLAITNARTYQQLEKTVVDLRQAIAEIKTLSGLLPICASCKKIRDDKGYWNQIEVYIRDHSEVEFSHSICPECMKKLYPDYAD